MKTIRLFLVLFALPFMCISCEDEPTPETPNKLVGTRWVLSSENPIDGFYNNYDYIEFYNNDWCICFKGDELNYKHQLEQYTYDETTNKISVGRLGNGELNIENKVCVFDLTIQDSNNPELQSLSYIQDVNYVAPEANNKFALSKWATSYKTKDDYILGFLDNSRLVFKYPSELITYTQYGVHNYTYKDGVLTIDGISTYKVDGNKIKIGNYTFQKR